MAWGGAWGLPGWVPSALLATLICDPSAHFTPPNPNPVLRRFMNSKVLFKHLRHNQAQYESHMPVSVHVNVSWGPGGRAGPVGGGW